MLTTALLLANKNSTPTSRSTPSDSPNLTNTKTEVITTIERKLSADNIKNDDLLQQLKSEHKIRNFMNSNPSSLQAIKDFAKKYPDPIKEAGIKLEGVGMDKLKVLTDGGKVPGLDKSNSGVFLTGKNGDTSCALPLRVKMCLELMINTDTYFLTSNEAEILEGLKSRLVEDKNIEIMAFILKRPLAVVSRITDEDILTENNNTQQFIKQLAEREGVSEEKIKEIIIDSFGKSYCRGENTGAELHFEFDSGLSVYRLYKIVETITDPEKEITKDNKLLKEGKIKDNNFLLPLDIKNLSLSLNQEIKSQLRKDVEEISEIIKGNIKSTQEENYYSIDLGSGTVQEKPSKGVPQIILTRADDLFMRKLLEQEIPQIKKEIVAIHDILRLPGLISKVIVKKGKAAIEKRIDIDPAGTCIGRSGEKAKAISYLIYSEQIYFANLPEGSEDKEKLTYKKKLLSRLLSPVKIKLIVKNEKE
ncbi:6744_t:CDS:2 [Entrophospora sp. SA101]|nr:7407_t:CDS:2 [Entrophospora sp. SA101]CAJ0824670.1 6744_t:CDS:2 [Entrophospora sp. SA101]